MNTKFGYTTGTYAAAAAKAALSKLLDGKVLEKIEITLPDNVKAKIPINSIKKITGSVKCSVIKESIEEADVTHNMEIFAQVSFREDEQIIIDGGVGVGRITKPGLQLPIGQAAINPVPREMIASAIKELTARGVNIIISAPKGEEIASKTTNARLGIMGGISIIGTTGIMKPKSLASFKQTILEQLKFCKVNNFKEVIITPGNISEKAMQTHFRKRFQNHQIVQSGDYLGFTLKHVLKMNLPFLLAGHPGKIAKVLSGHFQTHYSNSPPANKAVIDFLKDKIDSEILKEIKESPTVEGIANILIKCNKGELLNTLAGVIEEKIKNYLKTDLPIPILLFNMSKELIGFSITGSKWINSEHKIELHSDT